LHYQEKDVHGEQLDEICSQNIFGYTALESLHHKHQAQI